MNMNGAYAPPSEDRYAALKDLDSLMKQTQLKEETTANLSASTWNANNSNGIYYTSTSSINSHYTFVTARFARRKVLR